LRAAIEARRRRPGFPVQILSQYVDHRRVLAVLAYLNSNA
jgi:hypothetical protein